MPSGEYVGSENCPFCEGGRVGWYHTKKSAPAHPKLWGWCGGDPDFVGPVCGTRFNLGVRPSRSRVTAAGTVPAVSEGTDGNIQASEPVKPKRAAKSEPAADGGGTGKRRAGLSIFAGD